MPIVRRTRAELDLSKVDWKRVAAATDREIAKQIAADPDTAPIFSARELSRAKRVVPPPAAEDVRAIRRWLGLTQAQFAARYISAAFRKVRAGLLEGPFSQDVESEGRDRSSKIDSS